jgi:hypothetical protein
LAGPLKAHVAQGFLGHFYLLSVMSVLPLGCCCPILLRLDRQIRGQSLDLAIQGEQGSAGSVWQTSNTQEGDYQLKDLSESRAGNFWHGSQVG